MILFPRFKFISVTFSFVIIIIAVFCIDGIVWLSKKNSGLDWSCILYKSGGKFAYAIARKGHLHRLFMPLILHMSV
jgi:hypothetical protein